VHKVLRVLVEWRRDDACTGQSLLLLGEGGREGRLAALRCSMMIMHQTHLVSHPMPYTIQASGHYDDGEVVGDDNIVPGSSSSSSGSSGRLSLPSLPPCLPSTRRTAAWSSVAPARQPSCSLHKASAQEKEAGGDA